MKLEFSCKVKISGLRWLKNGKNGYKLSNEESDESYVVGEAQRERPKFCWIIVVSKRGLSV